MVLQFEYTAGLAVLVDIAPGLAARTDHIAAWQLVDVQTEELDSGMHSEQPAVAQVRRHLASVDSLSHLEEEAQLYSRDSSQRWRTR